MGAQCEEGVGLFSCSLTDHSSLPRLGDCKPHRAHQAHRVDLFADMNFDFVSTGLPSGLRRGEGEVAAFVFQRDVHGILSDHHYRVEAWYRFREELTEHLEPLIMLVKMKHDKDGGGVGVESVGRFDWYDFVRPAKVKFLVESFRHCHGEEEALRRGIEVVGPGVLRAVLEIRNGKILGDRQLRRLGGEARKAAKGEVARDEKSTHGVFVHRSMRAVKARARRPLSGSARCGGFPPSARIRASRARSGALTRIRYMLQDADALPQLIGDYKPVDQWQGHINTLFYRFRGDQIRSFYQTFASADYRLAHALAADYFEKVVQREQARGQGTTVESGSTDTSSPLRRPLTVMELGPGNGNLAACFLSHLQVLDKAGAIYPRVQYVLVDWEQSVLDAALAHPLLATHRGQVSTHRGTVGRLDGVADGSVDRIICTDLWNDLPTKLMSRQANEIEEEFLR